MNKLGLVSSILVFDKLKYSQEFWGVVSNGETSWLQPEISRILGFIIGSIKIPGHCGLWKRGLLSLRSFPPNTSLQRCLICSMSEVHLENHPINGSCKNLKPNSNSKFRNLFWKFGFNSFHLVEASIVNSPYAVNRKQGQYEGVSLFDPVWKWIHVLPWINPYAVDLLSPAVSSFLCLIAFNVNQNVSTGEQYWRLF